MNIDCDVLKLVEHTVILTNEHILRFLQVSEILSATSPRDSAGWQSDDDTSDVTFKPTPFHGSISSNSVVSSPKNLVLRHRREVGDVLRQKERQSRRVNPILPNNALHPTDSGLPGRITDGPVKSVVKRNSRSPSGLSSKTGSSRANSTHNLSDHDMGCTIDDVTRTSSMHQKNSPNDKAMTKSASSIIANTGM